MSCLDDICAIILAIEIPASYYLEHLLFIPVVILIIVTIVIKDNDDVKWFLFNTAVINLVYGISCEFMIIRLYIFDDFLNMFRVYGRDLAMNSVFLLGFTRFFIMYFEEKYERLVTKKILFIFILGYDFFLISMFYLIPFYETKKLFILIIDFLILLGTLFCIFLVVIKLYRLKSLIGSTVQSNLASNIRRAMYICILQACFISYHLLSSLFLELCQIYFTYRGVIYENLYPLYISIQVLQTPNYQLFVIIDTCVSLIIIRSYKNVLKRWFLSLMPNLRCFKKNHVNVIVVQSFAVNTVVAH